MAGGPCPKLGTGVTHFVTSVPSRANIMRCAHVPQMNPEKTHHCLVFWWLSIDLGGKARRHFFFHPMTYLSPFQVCYACIFYYPMFQT